VMLDELCYCNRMAQLDRTSYQISLPLAGNHHGTSGLAFRWRNLHGQNSISSRLSFQAAKG
jgi:hypothetical protein